MAATDLLGTLEAKQYLGISASDSTKDTLVAAYTTAASVRIVNGVGPVVYGTLTETYSGGGTAIYLRSTPVQGVTQVVEYDETTASTLTASTNSSQPSDAYVVDLVNGKLTRRDLNATAWFPVGIDNVQVTYVAGRAADTASVPERYKVACGLMLQSLWRSQQTSAAQVDEFDVPQSNFPRFAVPNAVKELLADEWRTGSGIGD